jgi:prepilin-type N-terminal cleavage/methylation domain-containing protein
MMTRPAAPRAFTLLEVTIVLALSGVLFLTLILWLASLNQSATQLADRSVPARSADFTTARISYDLAAATPCSSGGTAVRTLTPTVLELFITATHTTGEPGLVLVRWQTHDTLLTRTTWDLNPTFGCAPTPGANPTARIIATHIDTPDPELASSVAFFTSVREGTEQNPCVTVNSCPVDAVRVRATFLTPQPDTGPPASSARPVRIDRTLPVRTTGGMTP